MSDEWNWGQPEDGKSDPARKDREQQTGDQEAAATRQGSFGDGTDAPQDVREPERRAEGSEETEDGGDAGEKGMSGESDQTETYHWVNPRVRGDGSGTQENTYETSQYREDVTSQPADGGQENAGATGQTGGGAYGQGTGRYQGSPYGRGTAGSYGQNTGSQGTAGNWGQQGTAAQGQDGSRQNGPGSARPATGQRRYGDYQMGREKAPVPEKKKKDGKPMGTGKRFLVTAGMAVVFGVIAGGVMFGVNYLGQELTGQNRTPVQVPSTSTAGQTGDLTENDQTVSSGTDGGFSVAQVAENAMPSVVSITSASVEIVQDFFGGTQEYPIESAGSGIIVGQNDEELLIATNNHVVTGAETLTVSFADESSYEAVLKGTDEDNDLAVISVKFSDLSQETLAAIKVISLGDSDALQIGEQVVAIGNALGYGQSVTSGWVSAVDRDITDENGSVSENLIQTDAAINPGNSGGALLNMSGELIGINVAKTSGSSVEGMGYAIPIAVAEPILDGLMSRETRFKVDEDQAAYIGVTCLNVDSSVSQMYGIPEGAFVDSVESEGPAEQAGIQANDVITEFDGVKVSGSQGLVDLLEYYEAGETVEVVFARAENGEYKEHTVSVTLGKRSEMKQEDPSLQE